MTRERTAELRHVEGETFEVRTGSGRQMVFGDRPEAGELSPVETVAAALAACSAMDVVSILAKKRQSFDSYRVRIAADQRDEPYPQVFTRVDVIHELEGPQVTEAAVRRAVELSATKYCPVSATVAAGETVIHHHYRVRSSGQDPTEATGVAAVTGPFRRTDLPPT
jgi:putative redox protein